MKAVVAIKLKEDVPDSEGKIALERLHSMGLTEIRGLRSGRLFEFEIEGGEQLTADRLIKEACQDLLANTALEDFEIISIVT